MTGGGILSEVDKTKGESVKLFQKGAFKLQKWHSNEQAFATNDSLNKNELNFVKQLLGTKLKEIKILGLLWDKREVSFIIQLPNVNKNATNLSILSTSTSIYDQLEFVSSCLLLVKIVYCILCDLKVS